MGLGTWTGSSDSEHWRYETLQKIEVPASSGVSAISASLGSTIVCCEDGQLLVIDLQLLHPYIYTGSAYAFGYDSTGQLGLGLKDEDDKVVPTPQKIQSAHLEGYAIINISLGDQHSIFLAKKQQ